MMIQVTELENLDVTVRVKCDFIIGSDAKGCMVLLVSEFGNFSMNLTKNINEIADYLEGVANPTYPLSCYGEVYGFDIKHDTSVGKLAIPGNIKFLRTPHTMMCSLTHFKAVNPLSASSHLILSE